VKYFIDGKDYFNKMRYELEHAEKEIFITGWWLTPEMFLKRPISLDPEVLKEDEDKYFKYRLDQILLKKAQEGVKIFILIYKEVEIAGLYNNSVHAKNTLMGLHSNIRVIRHPRTLI
jgi:phospholipase D1/2